MSPGTWEPSTPSSAGFSRAFRSPIEILLLELRRVVEDDLRSPS
jgi:hypothetical protein